MIFIGRVKTLWVTHAKWSNPYKLLSKTFQNFLLVFHLTMSWQNKVFSMIQFKLLIMAYQRRPRRSLSRKQKLHSQKAQKNCTIWKRYIKKAENLQLTRFWGASSNFQIYDLSKKVYVKPCPEGKSYTPKKYKKLQYLRTLCLKKLKTCS